MSKLSLVLMISLIGALISCQNSNQNQQGLDRNGLSQNDPSAIKSTKAEPFIITVISLDGKPIEQAKILIGSKQNDPFANNFLVTDKSGQVEIPAEWNQPASVTVDYPGYMRVTYHHVAPQSLQFKLQPLVQSSRIELSGITKNFGPLRQDNKADFGLVIQAFSRADLFTFNIDKLISPENDTISFAGFSAPVPSNITFPSQRESYVVPIDIQKEKYRLYFKEKGLKKVYALHGQFPFKETIDQFRRRDHSTDIINSFNIVSGTMREIEILGPTKIDLPVDEMKFDYKETVIPPTIPPKTNMITVSLFEKDGLLYPTDMKKAINKKPFSLKSINNSNRVFISLLANLEGSKADGSPESEASSIEFVAQSPSHTPNFLNLIEPPSPLKKASVTQGWVSQPPISKREIAPLTTYSVLSKVVTDGKRKRITRQWEVYSNSWINSVELPEWPEPSQLADLEESDPSEDIGPDATEGHRWDVAYIGTVMPQPIPPHAAFGPDISSYMTHVSANSVEY